MITKRFFTGISLILFASIAFAADWSVPKVNFYVNGDCGNDSWSGRGVICEAPDGPKKTIQAAINVADDGDVIEVEKGTYDETITISGKRIILRSQNPNDSNIINTTVICGSGSPVVTFDGYASSSSVLEGFTVTNGNGNNNQAGGINCFNSSPIIRNCTITGNTGYTGGVYSINSNVVLDTCLITDNKNALMTGGIHFTNGSLYIANCIIRDNTSSGITGLGIGGISIQNADITICNTEIIKNTPVAISCTECNFIMKNCLISDNEGMEPPGVIRLVKNPDSQIINCTIVDNRAAPTSQWNDLILFYQCGSSLIMNTIIWGNTPNSFLATECPNPTVHHCNIQGGWEGEGNIDSDPLFGFGDDYHLGNSSPCVDSGSNDIPGGIWEYDLDGNPRVQDGDAVPGAMMDMGCYEYTPGITPALEVNEDSFSFYSTLVTPYPEDQILLLRNTGDGILDWFINKDCPWLDVSLSSGDNAGEKDEIILSVDIHELSNGDYYSQIEITSPQDSSSPLIIPIALHISNTIRVPQDYPTIQEAINAAVDGDTVEVGPGTYTRPAQGFGINFNGKAITVRSEEPDNPDIVSSTIVDGNNFYSTLFVFASHEDPNSVLSGFTLTNCNGSAPVINCISSSPTIEKCIITNNNNCGINMDESSAIIRDCTIKDNNSRGINVYACQTEEECICIIDNCDIINNQETRGAGIEIETGSYVNQRNGAIIKNCRILGNTGKNAAGMYLDKGYVSLTNCIIANNTATEGNVVGNSQSRVTVENCTFANNTSGPGASTLSVGETYATTRIKNCIFWNNVANEINGPLYEVIFSDVKGGYSGVGNIDIDPLFEYPENDHFHLQLSSPCICSGDPRSDYSNEPLPNGGRINMGAYGNTPGAAVATDNDLDNMPDTWESIYSLNLLLDDSQEDLDNDTLKNIDEYLNGCHPGNIDTDSDTMTDFWELDHNLNPLVDDGDDDADGDDLLNKDEWANDCDPWDADTDDDLMPDGWEVTFQLNPLADDSTGDNDMDGLINIEEFNHECNPVSSDTDSDLLNDYEEIHTYGTLPNRSDTDEDGLDDGSEILTHHTNPLDSDTDDDTMTDGWEVQYNLNPLLNDSQDDLDGDGLKNVVEFGLGTNPNSTDSDDDAMPDNYEVDYGLNPISDDALNDLDNDGFRNIVEYVHGTRPDIHTDTIALMTIRVPEHVPYIQSAIDAALETEEIIVADGLYHGQKNNYLRFDGKTVTLHSQNGPQFCVIDAENNWESCLYFSYSNESHDAIIQGFTMKNSRLQAILCRESSPTIKNCIIQDSDKTGIYLRSSEALIEKCMIICSQGTGIVVYNSSPNISDCVIYGNLDRGLILEYGNSIIENCLIIGNSGLSASAVYHKIGTVALRNCLIANNHSEQTSCIYATSSCNTEISGCTIAANSSIIYGGITNTGNLTVINSIVWDNNGSILTGGMGQANVAYSLIEGGYEGEGNINSDPHFATGPKGNYYLSQIAAGQTVDSLCVNAGNDTAEYWGMDLMTTRTDEINDTGIVDMGYHYSDLIEPSISPVYDIADFNQDEEINLLDFTILRSQWQGQPNNPSADTVPAGGDGIVDMQDIDVLLDKWLQ